jgi:hypothetical protein
MDSLTVYIARNKSILVPISLETEGRKANQQALLDSGATENFLHPKLIEQTGLKTRTLARPKKMRNVDGTLNGGKTIDQYVQMNIQHNGRTSLQTFFVAELGEDRAILGYPFLEAFEPKVDWKNATLPGPTIVSAQRTDYEPLLDGHPQSGWQDQLEEPTDEVWLKLIFESDSQCRKSTVAQELAIQATDKTERTWQEQVPKEYHDFGRVFSEEESQRFPERRRWDHAIDLKEDAPAVIDCKVYPLSQDERVSLKKFLQEHLKRGTVIRSNSRIASSFFFIKKKDGKLRPVQDYRKINDWTIKNKYPLPLISELIPRIAKHRLFTKFDIRWGYNNIRIKEGDEHKAAFKTSEGLFEPTVMFFGLTNSPATFQTMMDDIFREETVEGWLFVYMDDIVIATEDNLELHRNTSAASFKNYRTTTSS